MDSAASHHVILDLSNLSLNSEYIVPDEIVIGWFKFAYHPYWLYISQKTNNVYVEFHPSLFFVKDHYTGATLMRSPSKNGVYILAGNVQISNPIPIALIDAYWTGDLDDHTSTSAFVIFIENNVLLLVLPLKQNTKLLQQLRVSSRGSTIFYMNLMFTFKTTSNPL
ncbi:hypothetical protein ACH5RR_009027 [Cinchona calisaya]|uniref:Uncharacterized protein n=1 Tax=Cinchona calisaya TaxID=153742 RepID=A0ABD3AGM6_9GENT